LIPAARAASSTESTSFSRPTGTTRLAPTNFKGEPWGHSVVGLLKALHTQLAVPSHVLEAAQLLDTYYIAARYPNGWVEGKPADYFNQNKAEEALRNAEEIFRFVRDKIL